MFGFLGFWVFRLVCVVFVLVFGLLGCWGFICVFVFDFVFCFGGGV